MRRLLLASAALLALATPAAAQVATNITPDAGNAFATGTTITRAGQVTTIDGGARAGANLFHSFTTFDLAAGETARWTASNPTGVANVINRVTGGAYSTIAGTLDSTGLPNASFYFINPAGVLFTTGAQVNVPNAAYFSTAAGGITFADGAKFSAVTPNGSTFSMAAPQSFGFLGPESGIVIDTVGQTFVGLNTKLSFSAANVGIQSSNFVPLSLDVIATGGQARSIALADPLAGPTLGGVVIFSDSRISTTATGKGIQAIRVGADSVSQFGGFLTSSTTFSGDAGDLIVKARDVDISGFVASNTGETVTSGNAGTVSITASTVRVSDEGQISSSTFGVGDAGALIITADDLLLETAASIGSDTIGANTTGKGGTVQINVGTLTVRDGANISSSTNGRGDAGSVFVKANSILLDTGGGIDSVTLGGATGNGGSVQIEAGVLDIRGQAGVASFSSSLGNGGNIQITAGKMTMSGVGNIFSTGAAGGSAGNVTIKADSLAMQHSVIGSDTLGPGRAGVVTIGARSLTVADDSFISSSTSSSGAGGKIAITTDQAQIDFSTVLSAAKEGSTGNAGDVTLNVAVLKITNDSLVSSSTLGSGAAGRVLIAGDQALIDFSTIGSQALEGSTGAAGDVTLNVAALKVTNQTAISSSTFGAGRAGLVSITAKDFTLDASGVASRTLDPGTGDAGTVAITTGTLTVDNGAGISSSTTSAGKAGDVKIVATKITLDHDGTIESGAGLGATGNGGTVSIATDSLILRNTASLVTSTLAAGNAGTLQVTAKQISVESGSLLSSRARGAATGSAGGVLVQTQSLQLLTGGQIETSSQNPNTAGGINVASGGSVTIDGLGSHIASENLSATGGAAGGIVISGAPILLSNGGSVSTNSVAGAAGAISLLLPSDSYLRLDGRDAPGVITTSSGPGTGGKIIISEPLAVISNGGRILALGQAQGANVQLRSNFFIRSADRVNQLSVDGTLVVDSQVSDVSAGASIPDVSFLDASGVLRGQCPAARNGGVTSQLSLRAFGPYVAAPPPKAKTRVGALAALSPDHCQ